MNGLELNWDDKEKVTTVTLNGQVLYVEKGDIRKSKCREKIADAICTGREGINRDDLLKELNQLAGKVMEFRSLPSHNAVDPNDWQRERQEMLERQSPEVREEAKALLHDPDLFKKIIVDIAQMGVAGELELTSLLYLVGTSRLLDHPLAAIVQGPSSSGKSFIIERTVSLFPPEAAIIATQMTPQALFHMQPGSLVHRLVVGGERSRLENDDRAEATRALREMLSSGRLTKLMPQKKSSGDIKTEYIAQEGPIAYIESTTLPKIFDEDANRCILLQTDEQEGQTRRIIQTLANQHGGQRQTIDKQPIIEKHYALQRILESVEICIPYVGRLGDHFPTQRIEARRAFDHVLYAIMAVTLIYQFQRKRDSDGRLR